LEATKVKSCRIKLNWKELSKYVKQNPESKLSHRAKKFGVNPTAIFYALTRIKITKKKQLCYRERNR
jgi:transposase